MNAPADKASENTLRDRLRDEPSMTPEDTRSELLAEQQTHELRDQLKGMGASPEDTRAELLDERLKAQIEAAHSNKEPGTEQSASQDIEARRIGYADATSKPGQGDLAPDVVKKWVEVDVRDFGRLQDQGRIEDAAEFMATNAASSEGYKKELEQSAPDIAKQIASMDAVNQENIRLKEIRKDEDAQNMSEADRLAKTENARIGADARAKGEMPGNLDMNNPEDREFAARSKKQAEADLQQRKQRETTLAMQGDNSVNVQRKGREIERDELILPRRIANTYTEVNGKFFAKDSNRLMFEDKGEKLATSSTDKNAIADMVTYAKAKQWESLKLSGSVEFRREAWLQAESQGIKTQGYTPKDSDLSALKTLTQERQTNAITPVEERQKGREERPTAAPRHDINKNQAVMHEEATKGITGNMQALGKNPALADRTTQELQKLAYWRGVVMEENKLQPAKQQDEALARFDKQAEDPQFLKKIEQATEGSINDKTTERTQQRDTHELSL